MRRFRKYLLIFFLFLSAQRAIGQAEKELDSLINRADNFYREERYDSSLTYNIKAFELIKAQSAKNHYMLNLASPVSLYIGKCLRELNDYRLAHKYLTYSLQLGKANRNSSQSEDAFTELIQLHQMIARTGASFPYPAIAVTEEVEMYFPITRVEPLGKDSILIRVEAGKLDGLTDSVSGALIIQRDSTGLKHWPEGRGLKCYVRKLDSNAVELSATLDKNYPVAVHDLLNIKTMVPARWRQLSISPLLMQSVIFHSNSRKPLYGTRYLYYYADSLTNQTLNDILYQQVKEVVEIYANDTATNNLYLVKGDKGIFAGENVMLALSHSREEDLKLFVNYIKAYPSRYRSNFYKFSEIYATWVINNTPLADEDLRPYLLSQSNTEDKRKMIANFSEDIRSRDLISTWFNEGMLMANTDNTDSSMYMVALLRDACAVMKDTVQAGWADYLEGFTWKKVGDYQRADSAFKAARLLFNKTGNKEGAHWASNALKNLKSSRNVSVQLQTGHLFQYLMAPSPNSRYLATAGSYDMMVKIWDISQGRTIHSFTAHTSDITAISYSPNGRYLATASADRSIKVWNAFDFSLLYTIVRPEMEQAIIFTPDSKQLVSGGNDSLIKFIDFTTGKVMKTLRKHRGAVNSLAFLPTNPDYLFSCGNDSLVYKWNLQTGDWAYWYKTKGRNRQVSLSGNGKYMSIVSTDTLIYVWNLETNKFYFTIPPNYTTRASLDIAYPAFSPDGNYLALSMSDDKLDLVRLKDLRERIYSFKNEKSQGMFDVVFSQDGQYLAVRMDMGGPLRLLSFTDWDIDHRPTIGIRDIRHYANAPLVIQFSRDNKSLYVVHEQISKLDLRNGSTTHLYEGAFVFMNTHIMMNDERTGFYSDYLSNKLILWDTKEKKEKQVFQFSAPRNSENIHQFDLSADNRFLFIGGEKGSLAGFSLPGGEPIFDYRPEGSGHTEIKFIRYDSIRQRLFIIDETDNIRVADARNGKILQSLAAFKPRSAEVTPKFIFVACGNSLLYQYDAGSLRLLQKIKLNKSGLDCMGTVMSHDYRYLVVQVGEQMLTMDTRSGKVLYERFDHDYTNGAMCISYNNKWLATGGFDNKIHLYDLVSGRRISNIYTPRGKDFMLMDSSGHYLAPKNTLEAVNFLFNNSCYGFEQFDSRYNRPDLVLKNIGVADSSLIRNFKAAWTKRMRKLGLSEKDLNADIHLPVTRLKNKFALKRSTYLPEYEINIECVDAVYDLRSLHVLVNNNPLYGVSGKSLMGKKGYIRENIKIPLSKGINQIKVYCINERGTASLPDFIEVNNIEKDNLNPTTYFIGIAVSNYKDSSMNLRFAAKDVRDLAASFDTLYNYFEADTLIDRNATRENILDLRKKLMQTTVNDRVIISVNGHGLLDDSLDFYYATWDMDFSKPAARGLKYEELEALLDGIPARKKLLLIDACHSGALDKEELLARQKQLTISDGGKVRDTVTSFTARGTIIRNSKQATDINSSFELMQNLFADISAGNGAVIISAAGGMEFAFESEKWNNGVFTYCVRKGIEEKLADKQSGNDDGLVDVGELKDYVSRKVSELTGGKQRPVSRQDNLDYRWYFW